MWDLPRPGLEPVSPALAGRFLTTATREVHSLWFLNSLYICSASTSLFFTKPSCFNLAAILSLETLFSSLAVSLSSSAIFPAARHLDREQCVESIFLYVLPFSIPTNLFRALAASASLFSLILYIFGTLGASLKSHDIWESHFSLKKEQGSQCQISE